MRSIFLLMMVILVSSIGTAAELPAAEAAFQAGKSPFVFPVEVLKTSPEQVAMLLIGDLTGEGRPDFVLCAEGGLTAYDTDGNPLWKRKEAIHYNGDGNPGWNASNPRSLWPMYSDTAGCFADVDGDGRQEFVYLAEGGFVVRLLDGPKGEVKRSIDVREEFGESQPFTYAVPGKLFGEGEYSSLVLFRHHYHVPHEGLDSVLAVNLEDLKDRRMWRAGELMGINYAPPRVIDLDGDGWDEVITGLDCFDHLGNRLWQLDRTSDQFTTDQVGDFLPDKPGLEVCIGEYGHAGTDPGMHLAGPGEQVYLRLSMNTHSACPGRFFADLPGEQLLIRNNTHTGTEDIRDHRILVPSWPTARREVKVPRLDTPWKDVLEDGRAKAEYPRPLDWDGDAEEEILAVERHTQTPRASVHKWRTGERLAVSEHMGMLEGGARVYDVLGDGREEFILWNDQEVAVYFNTAPSANPNAPRKWESKLYRRLKERGNVVYNAP